MSELKAYLCIQAREIENKTFSCYNQTLAVKNAPEATMAQVYLKSEADKVIADLEESHKMEVEQLLIKIAELQKQVRDYAQGLYVIQARAEKEARHQKYRRCLAMARWCEATALWCYQAANTLPAGFHATLYGKPVMIEPNRLFNRHMLLTKWSYRWSELAEKFNEAK